MEPNEAERARRSQSDAQQLTTGELVARLSEQTSRLVRSEMRLALSEMEAKAKHAGVGIGLTGAAGVLSLLGGGVLVAAVILALDLVWPAWVSALVVAVALLALAVLAALAGKQQVSDAMPAVPRQAMGSVKQDIETIKEARHHDHTD